MLRGITWDHPRGYEPLVATAGEYASKTGVNVIWDKRSLKDFGSAPLDELAGTYDMLVIDHPHAGIATRDAYLAPLDELLPSSTLNRLMSESAGPSGQSYRYAGHQWALALDAAHQVSAYRPDVLEAAAPTNWAEAIELGRQLTDSGVQMLLPLAPTDCICSFLTLCASQGSPPGDGGRLVRADIGVASLDWLRLAAEVAHPESLSWNPIQCLDYMAASDDAPYCPITFSYSNYAREGYAAHTLAFWDIPGVRGALLGGAGFAVSAFSRQQQAAAEYGAWLCSEHVQSGAYVVNGGQPGNRLAWLAEDSNRMTNHFFESTYQSLEAAYVRPRHSEFVQFQEWAGNVIHTFVGGYTDAETVLADLEEAYRTSLIKEGHGEGRSL